MQSHKNHIVAVFVKTVYIGYKRYLLQKATESRILLPLLVINSLVYKLINILNTLLCFIRALCLQLIDIAGLIDYSCMSCETESISALARSDCINITNGFILPADLAIPGTSST